FEEGKRPATSSHLRSDATRVRSLSQGSSLTAPEGEETPSSGSKHRVLEIDIKLGKDRIRGWDVARRARAINPGLPVVYITGANADEWAFQGVPNSVLLTKPFAPAQLVTAVSNLLNTGSPIA